MAQWNLTPAFMNQMRPQVGGDMFGLPPQLRGVMPTPMEQAGQWAGGQPIAGRGYPPPTPPGGRGDMAIPGGPGMPGYDLRGGQGGYLPPTPPGGRGDMAMPGGPGMPGYDLRGGQGGYLPPTPPGGRGDMAMPGGPGMPGYSLRGGQGGYLPPTPQGGGNGLVGRTTNSGYVLPSLQDLLGKYAGWAMPQPQGQWAGGAQPIGNRGQGAGNGGQPIWLTPSGPGTGNRGQGPAQPPQGGGIPGGPGYSLGGPNGRQVLYDNTPAQGGTGWMPPSDMQRAAVVPNEGGGSTPPPNLTIPYPGPAVPVIPGTQPIGATTPMPGSGTVGTSPNPVVPAPVLGPVNPNAPGGGSGWGPGYGNNSGWPGGWTPPSTGAAPKPPTATPTPGPSQGGGSGGGGWTAQPAPSNGGGAPSTGSGGSGQTGDNGFGPAPNAQQLAYLQYQWEQQQWQDKLGQDAAALQWQKDQFGQNMDWQKQQWGGQFGLQQDQFGLNVLKNQQDYGLAQDQFGLNVLKNQQDYGLAQTGMGLNQDQFGLNVLDWQAKQGQQQWANQFNQNQFDWSKQMDTARNDIAKQNASFAAFGRRFAPNVNVM